MDLNLTAFAAHFSIVSLLRAGKKLKKKKVVYNQRATNYDTSLPLKENHLVAIHKFLHILIEHRKLVQKPQGAINL